VAEATALRVFIRQAPASGLRVHRDHSAALLTTAAYCAFHGASLRHPQDEDDSAPTHRFDHDRRPRRRGATSRGAPTAGCPAAADPPKDRPASSGGLSKFARLWGRQDRTVRDHVLRGKDHPTVSSCLEDKGVMTHCGVRIPYIRGTAPSRWTPRSETGEVSPGEVESRKADVRESHTGRDAFLMRLGGPTGCW